MVRLLLALLIFMQSLCSAAVADVQDPFDPFDSGESESIAEQDDKDKTAEELTAEAQVLFDDERPLDGRTKLLHALEKDPKYYQAHLMLAGYYIRYVGHFRLALKYVKQAESVFESLNGKPPYEDSLLKAHHAHILYLLSQARLNLDNYQGALDILDQYSGFGYFQSWYPGTRSWVLMKLGRVDEAIKVARLGILAGAEPGRTLNMLGILLSMTNQRTESLEVFDQAIRYEMSLGDLGQPATPLNNSGEVYKEIFSEDRAIAAWRKATSLPDGCEHVLPALNLALLYLEELNFDGAKRTIDGFESCVAQFPLRNGEEHKALVHLARGRIDMHTGKAAEAIQHFDEAIDRRQWFGKIGTNEADLQVAALISLSQALAQQNQHLSTAFYANPISYLDSLRERAVNEFRSWWLMRRATQILVEDLANFEDLYVRHTDSLIEYPTLGDVLINFPKSSIDKRLADEKKADDRAVAANYYDAYRAEVLCDSRSTRSEGLELIEQVLSRLRPEVDDLLSLHLKQKKLSFESPGSARYEKLALEIFTANPAALRNFGFKLPVNFSSKAAELEDDFSGSAFLLDQSHKLPFSLDYEHKGAEHILSFNSNSAEIQSIKVTGADLIEALNKFSDTVFTSK